MTSLDVVLLIIIANTVMSLVYFLLGVARESVKMQITAGVLLLTPPVGFLCVFGQFVAYTLYSSKQELSLEEISFSKEFHNRLADPDVEGELQTVPMEELLLVSSPGEKRAHLLRELKKEAAKNYGAIAKALGSDDAEVAHYAAAAITQVKTEYENELRVYEEKYAARPGDVSLPRAYCDYVQEYMNSGTLSPPERKRFSSLHIDLLTRLLDLGEPLDGPDYKAAVDDAVFLGDYGLAERWAESGLAGETPGEGAYLSMIKVCYCKGDGEGLMDMIEKLRASHAPLSEDGLALVRYFSGGRVEGAVTGGRV